VNYVAFDGVVVRVASSLDLLPSHRTDETMPIPEKEEKDKEREEEERRKEGRRGYMRNEDRERRRTKEAR
jgi:hypothetical protein